MRVYRTLGAILASTLLLVGALSALAAEGRPILVFAAASLTDALSVIGRDFEAEYGSAVIFSFAGSMTLARQIEASSGPDLFIAADLESMAYVEDLDLIMASSRRDLLSNRLVLVAPEDSSVVLSIEPGFALIAALEGGRLAVADTLSVPAGRYAKAALTSLGMWDETAPRLAEAEDVRAALALVARGESPLGIVYATDASAEPRVRTVGEFPEDTHPPILYPAALTRDAKPGTEAFLDYLEGPSAREVFVRYGFSVRAATAP